MHVYDLDFLIFTLVYSHDIEAHVAEYGLRIPRAVELVV
jgi:hypothetical protein